MAWKAYAHSGNQRQGHQVQIALEAIASREPASGTLTQALMRSNSAGQSGIIKPSPDRFRRLFPDTTCRRRFR